MTVPGRRGRRRPGSATPVADLGEPGLHADRRRAGAAHLDPVVLRGVVAGGEHRAGLAEVARGEVEPVGRGQPDLHHVGARVAAPSANACGEPRRARPHVVPDDDGRRAPVTCDEGGARATGELLVDLVGHDAADVVRLEDGAHVRGIGLLTPATLGPPGAGSASVGGEHAQVPLAGRLAAGPPEPAAPPHGGDRARGLADRVGQGEQVVGGRPPARGSGASRRTSQPRGALSRSECSRTGRRRAARRRSRAGRGRPSGRRRRR